MNWRIKWPNSISDLKLRNNVTSTNDVKGLNDNGMKKFDKEELEVNYELYKITSNRVC